jgi:hypothetical protein
LVEGEAATVTTVIRPFNGFTELWIKDTNVGILLFCNGA